MVIEGDMSEQEQVTASILRAQAELDQALRELDKMPALAPETVAYSAHALNNYLTVTGGTVELLLRSLAGHPNPQIKHWLEGLGHVTELMRHTVSQLMATSPPKDAKLRFLKWDAALLIQRACNYYQRIADPKNIFIVYESAANVPPVWTDPVAVGAVMDNILSNAVKYSFPGGRILVKVWDEITSAVCSVCDEGPGLSQEDQTKLFQRGVRLSAVPTGGETSNGYGLAVAKELIDKLGGDLWYESAPGGGSCFSFRLPAYQEQQ